MGTDSAAADRLIRECGGVPPFDVWAMRMDLCLAAQALTGAHAGKSDEWRYELGSRLFRHLEAMQQESDA